MVPVIRAAVVLVIAFLICVTPASAQKKKKKPRKKLDHTAMVDPFIGSQGNGLQSPGAVLPYGMAQAGPVTRLTSPGYQYTDTLLYGFGNARYYDNDTTVQDEILFMPTTGSPELKAESRLSSFKKKTEKVTPGIYTVKLEKYDIEAEITATTRAILQQYDFPSTPQANIIIDLQHGSGLFNSSVELVGNNTIKGYRLTHTLYGDRHLYFYTKFSKPFKAYGISDGGVLQQNKLKVEGKNSILYVQFDNPGSVIVKTGLSYISAEGALKNLDTEIPAFDFDATEKSARAAWVDALAIVDVQGGAPGKGANTPPPNSGTPYVRDKKAAVLPDYVLLKQKTFYTALYHAMLATSIASDIDGQYRNADGKTGKATGFTYYNSSAFGDEYSAQYSLLTLLGRKRAVDIIKSRLSTATADSVAGAIIPFIVDAYAKGIKDFDAEKAYTWMKNISNSNTAGRDAFRKNGYVSANISGSVSKTLRYAYQDWCIAQMARLLNKTQEAGEYLQRAQYWKNLFNNQTGYIQPRNYGGWTAPFTPTTQSRDYNGANARDYTFAVSYDAETLVELMGGKDSFEAKLDELNNAETPKKHISPAGFIAPYLYTFTNTKQKTQLRIQDQLKKFSADADGIPGNDHDGGLSAGYVVSALGIYNIAPGQQQYIIGLPQFDETAIKFYSDSTFTILNAGAGISRKNVHIQGMNLNKEGYSKLYLNYDDMLKDIDFEVFTGNMPNKLFMQSLEMPALKVTDNLIIPLPYIISAAGNVKDQVKVDLKCIDAAAKIYYTLDASTPTASSALFTAPFTVKGGTVVKAIAVKDGKVSFVEEAVIK